MLRVTGGVCGGVTAPPQLPSWCHALGAAGAIESVACLLMLEGGFVHASINCQDVHPDIERWADSIPHETREVPNLDIVIKSGFGFGDVNVCLVFRRWNPDRS